ncbi:hypothetical protein MJO28_003415 [Puccinia striiformis f. sp. tritici]|uniref:Uncharacterized protein n=1 Tax=Puccinia striiformis f. sp. tritici TaxID=168172 RepID=A0ACC0ET86_9BASI|nr:hypothetical protein MJO28_003415 [Puccinia striiformis f. sp. tritici]
MFLHHVADAAALVTSASRGARRFSYFLDRVENNLNLALKPLHSARQLEMGVNCILARISTLGYLYHYACTTNTTAIYLRGSMTNRYIYANVDTDTSREDEDESRDEEKEGYFNINTDTKMSFIPTRISANICMAN